MESNPKRIGVLFVCMGNICRSPTAEGVFRRLAEDRGVLDRLRIDSAGTISTHAGEPPDPRAQVAARRRGIELGELRARQVRHADYQIFDYVLAMDRDNLRYMERECQPAYRERLRLFLEFAPAAEVTEVPDPYYGGPSGFDHVLDLVHAAAEGLLDHIERKHWP